MFTQIEVTTASDPNFLKVYWLKHDASLGEIRPGKGVRIQEEARFLNIRRVFLSLRDTDELPHKAIIGTIIELN